MLLSLAACTPSEAESKPRTVSPAVSQSALAHYATLAFLSYRDAAEAARALSQKLDAFVSAPTQESLAEARTAWLAAREPYLQTEVFRFYDGPIDRVEMYVNPWPIDESYVDSSDLGTDTGIINDVATYPVISKELLLSLNEKQGETSISTGYHVIEFLLWGRDTNPNGPGARSHLDYLSEGERAPIAARRGAYLKVAGALLTEQLEQVRDAWRSDRRDNYRAQFLKAPREESLRRILKGLGTLSGSELAGERLTVAYETKDQENEHSCFSDNTHRDVLGDALGMQNLCLGRHLGTKGEASKGVGLCQVIGEVDPQLAVQVEEQIAETVRLAGLIPAPFDQAILGSDTTPGRRAISKTLEALHVLNGTLSKVTVKLGVSVPNVSARR